MFRELSASRHHCLIRAGRTSALLLVAAGLSACTGAPTKSEPELAPTAPVVKPAATGPVATWSDTRMGAFPKTGRSFRGPFLAEPLTLKLSHLPAHGWVKLKFNLVVLGSWDGSGPIWGPDLWSLQVRGGQRLACYTFSNMGAYNNNVVQSYPDDYPWIGNHAWTGAAAKDTLGFPKNSGFATTPDLNDAVYPVEMLFPHTDEGLTLDFMGHYGDPSLSQQAWLIDDFRYEILTDAPALDSAELPRLWIELGAADATQGTAALWQLVAGGDRTHAYISDRVAELEAEVAAGERAIPPVTGDEARRLHRAHKLVRILCGARTSDLCFRLEHLIPEYHR